ncbi:hypothetical protein IFR05_008475 [Cadophora sp. M221]|nr:hypothetical protein IFR05_008475 [Cadophora sp. M221]
MANQSKLARDGCVFHPRPLSALKRVKKALLCAFARRSKVTVGICKEAEVECEDEAGSNMEVEAQDTTITKLGKFEKFLNLPTELQDMIWGYYMILYHNQRDVHVKLTLQKLSKSSTPTNNASSQIHYAPSLLYNASSAPPPPLFSISHSSRTFAIKNSSYIFAIPLPLPNPGPDPSITKTNTITRLIPLDFTIGDKLTITFPFHSEAIFSWIAFHLSPGFTKYIKRPVEITGGNGLDVKDRRVLKAAGAFVVKKKGAMGWRWIGRGERSTVVTFRMCEIWVGLDVGVDEVGGGRVVERLRGVPVGVWDGMWIKLMEKLEVEGRGLTDDF